MSCQGCINRQRKLVDKVCKKPDGWLCRKARKRLERMLEGASSAKMARPEGASNTAPAPYQND